jgi:2-methylcitrate dehydratase PrpD
VTISATPDSRPATGSGSVAAALAGYLVRTRDSELSEEVEHAAVRAVADWFAAVYAGGRMPAPRVLARALLDDTDTGPSRLVATGRRVPCRIAALLNGTAAHTAELDDIYRWGLYHPGAPTIAAALAVGEQVRCSGEQFLRAVVAGYEVGCRVAAIVNPEHYRYWHTTGTVGAIGAAAAAGEILALPAAGLAHALATATTLAAGLQQAFRSEAMSKPLHSGHAAESGVLAAISARAGFTGALDVLEGEAGFGAAMSVAPDWAAALASLGQPPAITEVTVKNHSCCGHTFAAVDAALELRARGVDPAAIKAISVETYSVATSVAGNPDPSTEFEAKFSTQYCVAVALLTGAVRLRAFDEPVLTDPAVRSLMRRVTLVAAPDLDSVFPGQRAARLTIELTTGERIEAHRSTRKGDPDDPLTDAELRAKFTDLVAAETSDASSGELLDALWQLPTLGDIRDLPLVAAGHVLLESGA